MSQDELKRGEATSALFPSGAWSGYWIQGREQGSQDLQLHFSGGLLRGSGADRIGTFVIRGGYDDAAKEVWFTKQYLGAHLVSYRGFADGLVGIWGTWEIGPSARGGFRIWPRDHGEKAAANLAIEEPVLVPG